MPASKRAFLSLCMLLACLLLAPQGNAFDRGAAGFTVSVNGLRIPYKVMGLTVMPGETLSIQAPEKSRVQANAGSVTQESPARWNWHAPGQGLVAITVSDASGKAIQLNVFVLRPAASVKNGLIDGYRMGDYPQQAYRGFEAYEPPEGFIEVTPALFDVALSPHFRLGQFLCKQSPVNGKQFMLFRPELILKLETILQRLNERGIAADTLFIMSGYRTPHYNHSIGNRKYSRHIYGGAADFFVDVSPRDGRMDDLNGDGRIDRADAALVYSLVEELSRSRDWQAGGLGEYGVSSSHGPFVHVDVRGHRARWGRSVRN